MNATMSGSYRLNDLQRPEAERVRLQLQSDAVSDEEDSFLRAAGALPGARVLDLGCGSGEVTRRIGALVGPEGSAVGVDRDPAILPEQRGEEHIRFCTGEAGRLDGSLGTFDLIYVRFLLQHVPDPALVLRDAVRLLKPGGRVAVVDSDDALLLHDPPDPELEEFLLAVENQQRAAGGDRFVGRKLIRLMADAGLKPACFRFHTLNSVQTPFERLFQMATGYKAALMGSVPVLQAMGRRLARAAEEGRFFFAAGVCLAVGCIDEGVEDE